MRQIPLHDYAALPAMELAAFTAELQDRRTLAEMLAWGRAHEPPLGVAEILTQDEYTHDVVVPLGERLVLVFDTT